MVSSLGANMKTYIDKLVWIHIRDEKVLYARSYGKSVFYNTGGKREEGETDEEALIREIKEELNVDIIAGTSARLVTLQAQAHGQPEGVEVRLQCFTADFLGLPTASGEIEEIRYLSSADEALTTPTGVMVLDWLHQNRYIA